KIKIEYENGTNEIIEASKLQPPKSPANDLKREDDIKQPETKKGTENVPENIPENIPQEDSKVKYTQDKTELQKEVKTIMDDLITTIINTEEGKNYSPKTVRLLWGRFKKTGKYEGKTGDYGTEHDYQDLAEQIGINAYGDEIMPISRNEAVQEAMNFIIQELGLSATDFSSADFASKILNGYSSKIWEGARSIEDKINEDLEEMGVYLKEQEQEYKKQTEELLQKTLNIFKKPYNKNIGIDKKTFYEKLSLEAFNYLEANTPEGLPTEFESKLYEDMFNESKKYLEPENIIKESAEDVQQPDVQGERGKGIREVEQEIPEKRQEGDKTGITQQSDLKPKDSKKLTLELKSSPEKIHAAMSEKINLGKTGRGHVFDVERQNIATIKGDIIPKEIVKLNEVKKVYEPLKKAIMDGKEILWKMDSKNPVKEPTGQPRAKDSSGYAYFDPLGFAVNKTGDIRVFGNVKIADGTIEQRSYRLDTMADVKITNNSQVMTSKMLEEIGEGAYTNAYRATELETIKAQIRKAAPEEYDRIVSRSFKNTDFDVLQNKIRDNKEIWRKLNKLYECY
ncbi:MAG: hypothetical protein U9P90_02290, partial [Patescibacteria group bacterium]|nr:hypothetical protein [Patescibacteria group bacterium]